ncbi:MAG: hypothetical protein JNM28_06750 [Armatimonadetes bacterium]|nr:hypothetical protein [Armatimonadota bacterium]MBS1711706.1 hypothetical protein [Armatimonadota bacterium]MBX3109739.1 hypothetical protein [Fimbriimonadaceae bacterium]
MLSALVATAVLADGPRELYRSFEKGKTFSYSVRTHLQSDTRQGELNTFIPSEVDLNYDFTYQITDVKSSGLAKVLYQRPAITQIDGETADRGPVETKIPLKWKMELDLSPVNAVTGIKDLSPKTDKRLFTFPKGFKNFYTMTPAMRQDIVSQFAGELQRLALFIGGLDSSLDFAPKLPVGEVEVGDTWRQTMSYQPMELKGSGGKFEVQRLDMDLTYKGPGEYNGKPAELVEGVIHLDSDAAQYINQAMRMTANESGLSKLPLQLDSKITFYLDPKGLHTLRADARTTGGWSIYLTRVEKPMIEEKIKGRASITLQSIK